VRLVRQLEAEDSRDGDPGGHRASGRPLEDRWKSASAGLTAKQGRRRTLTRTVS